MINIGSNNLIKWLIVYSIFPVVTVAPIELFVKNHLLWYMRLGDVFSLIVTMPFFAIILFKFYELVFKQSQYHTKQSYKFAYFFSVATFFIGNGLHIASNAIHAYYTEVKNYSNIIPRDLNDLIYFLDEQLSHLIIIASLAVIFILLILCDSSNKYEIISFTNRSIVISIAVLHGVWLMISFVESTLIYIGLISAILPTILIALLAYKKSESFINFIGKRYLIFYLLISFLTVIISSIVYSIIFGGFIEPSKLGI